MVRNAVVDADTGRIVWQKKLDTQVLTRITGTAKLHRGQSAVFRLHVPRQPGGGEGR